MRPQTNTISISPTTPMYFMHFASLMEGGKAAWLDPANKNNQRVHGSVARGCPACKVYRHDMPDFAVDFLVNLGNLTNPEVCATTSMQVYRSTTSAEASWSRKKLSRNWTVASLGQVIPGPRCTMCIKR